MDSDTYAIAHQGQGQDGWIETFTVSADGTSITEVARLEYDENKSKWSSLVQVDSDTYALAYGNNNGAQICALTISADGSTITLAQTLLHDSDASQEVKNSIVKVDSDTYALAYVGSGSDGFITTFTISADGSTITEVASLEHDTQDGDWNSLVQVDSDTYALAYSGSGNDGYITTFTITSDGATITEVASLEHDTDTGKYNSLIQVDSDTYALAYSGSGDDGYITTFTISSDGATITEVASQEHDTDNGTWNSLVQVDSDTYALTYAGTDNDGYITTFTISADGSTITEVASFEHDAGNGEGNSIVQLDADTYVLGYEGPGSDGYIKTFTIQSDGSMGSTVISGNAGFRMMSSPLAGQIYSDLLDELWTQGMTGADVTDGTANVWTLSTSGSQSSSSWTALSDISGSGASLTAGAGFLVYVFSDTDFDGDDDLPVTLSISGTYNSSSATYGSVPDGNYALAGNPFPYTIDWDNVTKSNVTTAYVWDDAGSGYKSWNGSSGSLTNGLIAPLQGFLFLASGGTGSITIDVADKSSSSGTFYRILDEGSTGSITFNIVSGDYMDQTFVSFMNNGESGLDIADGYKLMPLSASARVVGLSYTEETGLDIHNLPFEYDGIISLPLDVLLLAMDGYNFMTEAGDATLSWELDQLPNHIELSLTDLITGIEIDLSAQDEYSFTTEPKGSFSAVPDGPIGPYPLVGEPRFTLHVTYDALGNNQQGTLPIDFALHPIYPNPFNPSTTIRFDIPNSLEIMQPTSLLVYDVSGRYLLTLLDQPMKPGYHEITWNPNGFSSGVYLVKLKTGTQTSTQKVTYVK
ncbi:MAG TPA: T9SS type A sorting domain-containing protein [Candidatus Marinimicrobia bacterium]|nr:T9SS type A sorting domain-containing protein [Candidatus Neomarinimicrobiota bacterium]